MDEDRREQLTRSAFMGALDDDNLIIHYIDKRVPERDSLASALEIAERYERENGPPATAMTTRLDAAQSSEVRRRMWLPLQVDRHRSPR